MLRVCRFRSPRGEMDIIQVSGTWGLGSIPGEGTSLLTANRCANLTAARAVLYDRK